MTQFNDPRDHAIAELYKQNAELRKFVTEMRHEMDAFDRYVALAQALKFTIGFGWVTYLIQKLR